MERAETAKDGSFHFTVQEGIAGTLQGDIRADENSAQRCPQFQAKLKPGALATVLTSPILSVTTTKDQSGLTLTFPFPSCREWRDYGDR